MENQPSRAPLNKSPTGIEGFDEITGGGLPRGTTTLIMGGPGCGKTVFALQALVNGAVRAKEPGVFVAFEESTTQIIANAATLGWDVAALAKSKLQFLDARLSPEVVKAGDFDLVGMLKLLEVKAEDIHAKRVVFDGIDVLLNLLDDPVAERRELYRVRDWLSLSTKVAHVASEDATQQFLDFLKVEGITVVNTSLMDGLSTDEATATGISTIADTWIHVSYVVNDGERNGALTIVKSRGTSHSNQVRELTLSDAGVNLTDVFAAQGKVLMGVARWEWEQEERAGAKRTQVAAELKRLQLQLAQAEAEARLKVVQTEIEARRAEIALLVDATGSASKLVTTDRAVLRKLRHADEEIGHADEKVRRAAPTYPKNRSLKNGHRKDA